jgi:hypothetical protein
MSHVGRDTGDLPFQGEKVRVSNPTRPLTTSKRLWRLSALCTHPQGDTLLRQGSGIIFVA